MPPRWADILLLLVEEGPMTADEIAELLGVDGATVRVLLWTMRRHGLVETQPVETGRLGRKPYQYMVSEEVKRRVVEKLREVEELVRKVATG